MVYITHSVQEGNLSRSPKDQFNQGMAEVKEFPEDL